MPDLTEHEARVLRGLIEGDQTYAEHLTPNEISRACSALAAKGYLNMTFQEKDPETGEWKKVRPPWSLRSRVARWLQR